MAYIPATVGTCRDDRNKFCFGALKYNTWTGQARWWNGVYVRQVFRAGAGSDSQNRGREMQSACSTFRKLSQLSVRWDKKGNLIGAQVGQ